MGCLGVMISLGPWGGPGGNNWNFMASGGIAEITINEEVNIKSISFKDATGNISGTFGGRDPSDKWGQEKKIEINWPEEYLTSISGTYGDYKGLLVIKSLSFITNLTTYGPCGTTTDGVPFCIPISNCAIVGFNGKAGYYLNALGIFVEPKDIGGTISLGPWGSPGGHYPWSYTTNEGITQINIYAKSNIKAISFRDSSGVDSAKFGGNNPNDPGEMSTVNINWPSEYLKSVSGTYGKFNGYITITSLSFITNLATHGPFGEAYGTSFSIPIDHGMVVGFHGRYGWYLDALGIFVKPVDTAT